MQGRQIIILAIAVVCLVFAGIRLARVFRTSVPERVDSMYRVTWRCRGDGYETNLTVREIDQLFTDNKWRLDPNNMAIKLVACPKCGKIQLEQMSIPVSQESRK